MKAACPTATEENDLSNLKFINKTQEVIGVVVVLDYVHRLLETESQTVGSLSTIG